MCRTSAISDNIVRLGGRTYTQRMRMSNPGGISRLKLARLNNDLDILYEKLYFFWNSFTEKDFLIILPQLTILLETINDLLKAYKKNNLKSETGQQTDRLKKIYRGFIELKADIENFKINIPKDEELKALMSQASIISRKIVHGNL